jgi:hypothetical protein
MLPLGAKRRVKRQRDSDALADVMRTYTSVLAALRKDTRRRALRAWATCASEAADRDLVFRRAADALAYGVRRMLHHWATKAAALSAALGTLHAAVASMASQQLARAFRSWADLRVDTRLVAKMRTLLQPRLRATRALERFRNEVALAAWVQLQYTSVRDIYEDRQPLWGIAPGGSLLRRELPVSRRAELDALLGWRRTVRCVPNRAAAAAVVHRN